MGLRVLRLPFSGRSLVLNRTASGLFSALFLCPPATRTAFIGESLNLKSFPSLKPSCGFRPGDGGRVPCSSRLGWHLRPRGLCVGVPQAPSAEELMPAGHIGGPLLLEASRWEGKLEETAEGEVIFLPPWLPRRGPSRSTLKGTPAPGALETAQARLPWSWSWERGVGWLRRGPSAMAAACVLTPWSGHPWDLAFLVPAPQPRLLVRSCREWGVGINIRILREHRDPVCDRVR